MKNISILKFSFFGWILIYLASCLEFNQKVISQPKRVDLSIENIVYRDMLDNSSNFRKLFNKTVGFNGKTYTIPIKYYIHDKNKKVNLKFRRPLTINYAYEISDDLERFIVDIFNSIDDYIDLDFERVFSPKKANILIFKTNKFHDYAFAYHEFQLVDNKVLSNIVWHAGGVANKQKLKDYPTLYFEYAEMLLHEIAHALGFYHSGCEQDYCKDNIDPFDSRFDIKDTIMSYNYDHEEYVFFSDLDIEALQRMWGVEKGN